VTCVCALDESVLLTESVKQGRFVLENAANRTQGMTSIHSLRPIPVSDASTKFAELTGRQESCNELCSFLMEPKVNEYHVRSTNGFNFIIWEGSSLQIRDWSERGCGLSEQIIASHEEYFKEPKKTQLYSGACNTARVWCTQSSRSKSKL